MNTERSVEHMLGELAEVIQRMTTRAEQLGVTAPTGEAKYISKTDAGRATAEDAVVLEGLRDYFLQVFETASASVADLTEIVDGLDRGEPLVLPLAARARMDALRAILPASEARQITTADPSDTARLYIVEPHGYGWEIVVGRDERHHGFTLGHLRSVSDDLPRRIEAALNRQPAAAQSARDATDAQVDLVAAALIEGWRLAAPSERDQMRKLVRETLKRVRHS